MALTPLSWNITPPQIGNGWCTKGSHRVCHTPVTKLTFVVDDEDTEFRMQVLSTEIGSLHVTSTYQEKITNHMTFPVLPSYHHHDYVHYVRHFLRIYSDRLLMLLTGNLRTYANSKAQFLSGSSASDS